MAPGGGLLVTLDGPSGVGKTTVSGLLGDRFAAAGVPVVLTTTPSSSSLGELTRHGTHQFSGAALTCLVAADRYHHDRTTVRDSLKRGSVVICDRYVPSSLVLDLLDGVERDHVWSIYRCITVPDVAFILVGDPVLCATRARVRGRYSIAQASKENTVATPLGKTREGAHTTTGGSTVVSRGGGRKLVPQRRKFFN
jgi:dTMP kinase